MKSPLLICFLIGTISLQAQENESQSQRKNTVKLDITSHFIYRNAMILAYERVTKPNQSFVVTAGYQEFPLSANLGSNISVKKNGKKNGLKLGGEYRFYLAKENKYLAPRGVYIGPYFIYHKFSNARRIEVDNDGVLEAVNLDSKLGILNVGFQLGYQFVINNRWAIDLVFVGPSVSNYRFEANLDGSYTFDKEDIQSEIILALIDRFPLLDELVTNQEIQAKGRLDTWSFGYRYQLQVGYHFGRKK